MNWDAIGAVGEIVGAVAVVLSLVYLAVQVRQNNRMLRRAASRDAVTGVRAVNHMLISDPGMARVVRDGLKGSEELDDDDQTRFHVFLFNFLKVYEDLHYQYMDGALDSAVWKGWVHNASAYLTTPGARSYWSERRHAFGEPFQSWVESLRPGPRALWEIGRPVAGGKPAGEGEK